MRRYGMQGSNVIRLAGVALVALALVASACGKDEGNGSGGMTTGGGTSTSAPQESGSTSAPTTSGGATSSPATSAPSTSGGGSSGATVAAADVGTLGMVLVDSRGFTLYHLDGETATKITCTGGCEQAWPPLEASGAPTAGDGATGDLGTTKRPDGTMQVTYDGLPLYTFSGDSAPGQANGQGVSDVWFAVTPAGEDATDSGGAGSGRGY
jgi:predicted lipoprotein with Yx(FWY)xxD motif